MLFHGVPRSGQNNYFNNAEAERMIYSGGGYRNSAYGVASFLGNVARSHSNGDVGFRAAFVEL